MLHAIVHVGMHKTGTTSIQNTFTANRTLLAEHGIHYASAARNHYALVLAAFGGGEATAEADAQAARRTFADEMDRLRDGRYVISGEDICRMTPDAVRALLSFFADRADRVSVVCFVRPPRAYMTSVTQQHIRGGMALDRLRAISPPRYQSHVQKFLDCADLADTILPLHDRRKLVRGCSIATMLDICGAPEDLYGRLELMQENPSMSAAGAALMLAMTSAGLPPKKQFRTEADRTLRRRAAAIANAVPGAKFSVPQELIADVLARGAVRADLHWMERLIGQAFDEPAGPAPDPEAAKEWPNGALTSLDRESTRALAALLRQEVEHPARVPGSGADMAGALERIEGWLRATPPDRSPFLPHGELVELARMIVFGLPQQDDRAPPQSA